MLGEKENSNTSKTNNTTRGNKSEGTGERRKAKQVWRKDQTIQTKLDIPKQQKKILPASRGENARRHISNWMTRKQNNFGAKFVNEENINRKAKWINNMKKELQRLKKRTKGESCGTYRLNLLVDLTV